jgi:uncharacterized protein
MYVKRDFLSSLKQASELEAVILWGPRQVGKTTLLNQLDLKSSLYLDDISVRSRAQSDPALVLDNVETPCLIDEAQYAPNLFPEIKLQIDRLRRERLKKTRTKSDDKTKTLFYITGSNRILLDKNVKESLAGRSHLFNLQGLSVKEIHSAFPELTIKSILWRGGFPELYTRENLSPARFLSDYISSFVEKDVAASVGVEKKDQFNTVLALLAARSGQFLNMNEIAGVAGVQQKTIQSWINSLTTNSVIDLVPAYYTNLNKRVTKMKKLFFYDTGLCARLQGHLSEETLWNSPQIGSLFETLVFGEITKTNLNFLKEWKVYNWRTKDQGEIDFVVQSESKTLLIESKMAIHGAQPFQLDPEAKKTFTKNFKKVVVTVGGNAAKLGQDTDSIPIKDLGHYLMAEL